MGPGMGFNDIPESQTPDSLEYPDGRQDV